MEMILSAEEEKKIDDLIAKMNLTEKIGQMNQLSPSIAGGFDLPFGELIEMVTDGRISQDEFGRIMSKAEFDYHEDDIREGKIGSFLIKDPKKANELQKIAVNETRLRIPLIFGFDVIHGFTTVFPIPLAEACSWNEEVFEESAKIAARESRAHNIHWTFAPMVDVARDARWGRIAESPGEDPYLASVFSRAKVRGFQGDDLSSKEHIASCLKHFVAYGAAEAGQDYNTVSMADNVLYNTYLPPVKAAVEEGAATVMAAFNDYNGIPCTVNKFLLKNILKDKYGFKGFVVSDANAIDDCVRHGIATGLEDASSKACNAGLDMDMGSHAYEKHLNEQVKLENVSEEKIDDAVRRILRIKMKLGLFENPYVSEDKMALYDVLPDEHKDAALNAAKRSIVLLKNEQVLPLKKGKKIALIGELADMPMEVLGCWAIAGRGKDCVSIYQGLQNAGANVTYAKTCGVSTPFIKEELYDVAEDADVIIAVVGETSAMSGEASSKADISIPGEQEKMLKAALETGKDVVTILMNGRPMTIPWVAENMPAVIEAWQLGIQMGNALAEVIFGEYNPSGKLSCTFPAMVGQCPKYYNHYNTGRPGTKSKFSSRYLDAPIEPLYPFGYGLSYTEFEYSQLVVNQTNDSIDISVNVKNTGKYEGEETVQIYVQDTVASLVRPVKELKGFEKVFLKPGDKISVKSEIKKSDIGFYDNDMNYFLEDGEFKIYVGTNSVDCLVESIEVKFI